MRIIDGVKYIETSTGSRPFVDVQKEYQVSQAKILNEITDALRGEVLHTLRHPENIHIPEKYQGKDIRLLQSEETPKHLGFWFWNGQYGHERYSLAELVFDMEYSGDDISKLLVAYLQ